MSTTNETRADGRRADRLLNKWAVEQQTSLDITTIYRKMKAGTFPQPLRIGKRRVAWRESRRGKQASRLARGCEKTNMTGRRAPRLGACRPVRISHNLRIVTRSQAHSLHLCLLGSMARPTTWVTRRLLRTPQKDRRATDDRGAK
jgi:prophage regulatory protein